MGLQDLLGGARLRSPLLLCALALTAVLALTAGAFGLTGRETLLRVQAGAVISRPFKLGAAVIGLIASLLLLLAATAPSAHALSIKVKNDTKQDLGVVANGNSSGSWCRTPGPAGSHNLYAGMPDNKVAPDSTVEFFTGGACNGSNGLGRQSISIVFKNAAGNWIDPYQYGVKGATLDTTSSPLVINTPAVSYIFGNTPLTQAQFEHGVAYIGGIPSGWFPTNPAELGKAPIAGAAGLYCVIHSGGGRDLTLTVTSDTKTCNASRPTQNYVYPGRAQAPTAADELSPKAEAQNPPVINGGVVDLFSMAKSLCEQPWPKNPTVRPPSWRRTTDCGDVNSSAKWDIGALTAKVGDRKALQWAEPKVEKVPAKGSPLSFDNSNTTQPQTFNWIARWRSGRSSTTSKCFSWGMQQNLAFEFGAETEAVIFGLGAKGNWKVTAGQQWNENWNDCKDTGTSSEVEQEQGTTITVPPRKITELRVYQYKGDTSFTYNAKLSAGVKNEAEPVVTPVPRALGMSGARVQPCIGYVVGGVREKLKSNPQQDVDISDPYSITGTAARLHQQWGTDPKNRKSWAGAFPGDQIKDALAQADGFTATSDDKCPGFPTGYAASTAFDGRASVSLNTYEPQSWTPEEFTKDLTSGYLFVPFERPGTNPTSRSAKPRADADDLDGQVVDGSDQPGDPTLKGDDERNLIMADDDQSRPEALVGEGGFDWMEGAAGRQEVSGGTGDDYMEGRDGPDDLKGGDGRDSVFGGDGDDRLVDDSGPIALNGEADADTLIVSGEGVGGADGGDGSDVLVAQDNRNVGLEGGHGDDTYEIHGTADSRQAVELDGGGRDTIEATGSIVVPPEIERVVASGNDSVEMRAGFGEQTLVGGPKADVLDGGHESDELEGRGGDDQLDLGEWSFDRASGGPGADTFVPKAMPSEMPLPLTYTEADIRPSAHRILDFDPGAGDRLLLTPRSFGPHVSELEDHLVLREGESPDLKGGEPQLLFSRNGSLLRFDPDGTGSLPTQVVAILEGFDRLPAAAIAVRHE